MDPLRVTAVQARWHRLRRSGLVEASFGSPEAVARGLFGVQAQINSAGRIALYHRLRGDSPEALREKIDSAIDHRHALVRLWGQRGTLHLYAPEDWPLVTAAIARREIDRLQTRARRSRGDSYLAHYRSCRDMVRRLLGQAPGGTVSKRDIEDAASGGEAEAAYGALLSLCLEGLGCRVETGDSATPEFAARSVVCPDLDWTPPRFDEAMERVAARFFGAYGPATEADLRHWLGAAAAETRKALGSLVERGELVEMLPELEGLPTHYRASADSLERGTPSPSRWPVVLLGRFDPLLLAYADKSWLVETEVRQRVWHHTHVEAVLLLHGRVAGIWKSRQTARGLSIDLQLFQSGPLPRYAKRGIERQAEDLAAFLGQPLLQLTGSFGA